jgi:hypothetical protein
MCGDQIFDLHLCLSASVNVRPILHTQPLGLYLKSQMGISLSTVIPNLSSHPLLAYLIYSSDGQHKKL